MELGLFVCSLLGVPGSITPYDGDELLRTTEMGYSV